MLSFSTSSFLDTLKVNRFSIVRCIFGNYKKDPFFLYSSGIVFFFHFMGTTRQAFNLHLFFSVRSCPSWKDRKHRWEAIITAVTRSVCCSTYLSLSPFLGLSTPSFSIYIFLSSQHSAVILVSSLLTLCKYTYTYTCTYSSLIRFVITVGRFNRWNQTRPIPLSIPCFN